MLKSPVPCLILVGNEYANSKGYTGWDKAKCIITGVSIGGVVGGVAGYYAAPAVTAITGIAGVSVTSAGITAVGTGGAVAVEQVTEKAITALQPYYPPNDGFSGVVQKITLEAGTLIQRTGELYGRFVAPAGTPTQMLSLPYDKIGQTTTYLQLQQSIEVLAGKVAPWFGQPGGGIQYILETPLDQLIKEGVITIFGG